MSATPGSTSRGIRDHDVTELDLPTSTAPRNNTRRLSTETKAAFKTTEFFAYLGMLIAVFIAGLAVEASDAAGLGAKQVWLYATILTVGYMLSRGIAKAGSRDPYDADRH
jgi:hypothetical protein